MVETVWEKFGENRLVWAQRMDALDISLPDACCDVVIANHMLHHVPDIPRALAEISRVLRADGAFYCSAIGEQGIHSWVHRELAKLDPAIGGYDEDVPFTMQNGGAQLAAFFVEVRRVEYPDSLAITETQPLVDWIRTTMFFDEMTEAARGRVYAHFESMREAAGGVLSVPKQTALFRSTAKKAQ